MEELRRNLVIGGTKYSLAVGQYGSEPPGVNTQGKVGVTYLDTANKRLYVCTAAVADAGGIECTWTPAGELIEGQGGSGQNAALTTAQIDLLEDAFEHIQWADGDGPQYAAQLIASLRGGESGGTEPEPEQPARTLERISAEYTGGNVPVGTAVSGLSGVTVTAHYSDGSTANVTGYTLSGTISEGDNTVTVTYMGKTATITVTGEAQAAEGRKLLHNWVLSDAAGSEIDTVGGAAMSTYQGVEKSADGWTIDDTWSAIYTPAVLASGMTVEWDIATAVTPETQYNGTSALFKFGHNAYTGDYWIGFKNEKWGWIKTDDWAIDKEIALDGINAFDGKTVALCIGEDGYISLYLDGVFLSTSPWAITESIAVVGHNSGTLTPCTVSCCRIYKGVL